MLERSSLPIRRRCAIKCPSFFSGDSAAMILFAMNHRDHDNLASEEIFLSLSSYHVLYSGVFHRLYYYARWKGCGNCLDLESIPRRYSDRWSIERPCYPASCRLSEGQKEVVVVIVDSARKIAFGWGILAEFIPPSRLPRISTFARLCDGAI